MRRIGKMLRSFMKQESLTLKLRKARAEAKMYAESTTHAKGPNRKRHDKAMRKVDKFAVKIEMIAQSVFNAKKLHADTDVGSIVVLKVVINPDAFFNVSMRAG
jgi:hypothetical protein